MIEKGIKVVTVKGYSKKWGEDLGIRFVSRVLAEKFDAFIEKTRRDWPDYNLEFTWVSI